MDFQTVVGLLIRHGLTLLAGGLLASGVITAENIEVVGAALATLAGVGWSIYQKIRAAKKQAPALSP